ncbi:MAG: TlpA family protein disulfide reductase [Limnochordia bacterium]|jgi:thiol-disulfide isomerase/thioredoxin
MKRWFPWFLWVLLLVLGSGLVQAGAQIGEPAAPFTLTSLAGEKVSLEDFRGQPVFVNFWTTWCPTCREEMMPAIQEYVDLYGKDVQVIGISVGENPADVRAFVEKKGYTWLQLIDGRGTAAIPYLVRFIPTNVFIDEEGIVVNRYIGPMTLDMLKAFTGIDDGEGD